MHAMDKKVRRARPTPPPPSPWRGRIVVMGTALVVLALFGGFVSIVLHFKGKADAAAKRERVRAGISPLLYHARMNLQRAGAPSSADPAEIRGLCEIVIGSCETVIELDPENEEAWRLRGRALELEYRFAEAREAYSKAIQLVPSSPANRLRGMLGLRQVARTLLESEDPGALREEAKDDFRRFVHYSQGDIADPQNRFIASLCIAWLLEDHENVHLAYRSATTLVPSEWIAPFLEGLACISDKEPTKALTLFKRAAELSPYTSEIHAFHGRTLAGLGRPFKAQEAYSKALYADPGFRAARFARADLLFFEGRYREARTDYRLCLKLDPSSLRALLRGAIAGFRAWRPGEEEAAETIAEILGELDLALEEKPGDVEALSTRALARDAAGRSREALVDLGTLLEKDPENGQWLRQRAGICTSLEEWDGAIRDLTRLGDIRTRARVRSMAGRVDKALDDLDMLQERDPGDASLFLLRAKILLEVKRWEEALQTLERLERINSSLPRAWLLRAKAYLGRGDPGRADELATQALEANPLFAEALLVRGKARLAQNRRDLAEADFRSAVSLDPRLRDQVPPGQTP